MASNADMVWYRGNDMNIRVTMTTPTDVTGWHVQFSVKQRFSDPTPLFFKTLLTGITVVDPLNGIWNVAISSADTIQLPNRKFFEFDFTRTDPGAITTLTIGTISLLDEVTE